MTAAADATSKTAITAALAARFGYTRYLELTSSTTGLFYARSKAMQLPTCMRLVYNLKEAHPDGLPVDFTSSTQDIAAAVAEIERQGLRFDVALVDPYHTYDISLRDLRTAYRLVRPGGALVVHDCAPPSKEVMVPEFIPGDWGGVTYKAFIDFCLANPRFDYFTVNVDWGCGVIMKSTSPLRIAKNMARAISQRRLRAEWDRIDANYDTLYAFFMQHKVDLLRMGNPGLLAAKLA